MRLAAKILVILSLLGGAFLVSLNPTKIDWPTLIPVILVCMIGTFLTKHPE